MSERSTKPHRNPSSIEIVVRLHSSSIYPNHKIQHDKQDKANEFSLNIFSFWSCTVYVKIGSLWLISLIPGKNLIIEKVRNDLLEIKIIQEDIHFIDWWSMNWKLIVNKDFLDSCAI